MDPSSSSLASIMLADMLVIRARRGGSSAAGRIDASACARQTQGGTARRKLNALLASKLATARAWESDVLALLASPHPQILLRKRFQNWCRTSTPR